MDKRTATGRKGGQMNAEIKAVRPPMRGGTGTEGLSPIQRKFPTVEDLRRKARARVPRFAFDFVDGGCLDNLCRDSNRKALDSLRMVPRYGLGGVALSSEVELFGRRYAAPIGVAPMGMGGLIWPNAERHIAAAMQGLGLPFVLATPATASIEEIAAIAPDVFWSQLYGAPLDDNRITFDLVDRAKRAGAHALVVTIDSPVRGKRPQDMRNGVAVPFRKDLRSLTDIARSPAWAWEVLRHGAPRCENFVAYAEGSTSVDAIGKLVQKHLRGGFEWETVKRVRDRWVGPMLVKGILAPEDAEIALEIGADGIVVSNHGGRAFDAAPPAIEMLPAIVAVAGHKATIMLDSGIRSGLDVTRALALGAKAVLAGRPFLFGVAALGGSGAGHAGELFIDEIRGAMGQIGAVSPGDVPGAVKLDVPGRR